MKSSRPARSEATRWRAWMRAGGVGLPLLIAGATAESSAPVQSHGHAERRASLPPGSVHFTAGRVARIPFDVHNNQIWIQGRVKGSGPIWIVLDTGAAGSVVDARIAESARLSRLGDQQVLGAGGAVQGGILADVTFHLPGLDVIEPRVASVPLETLDAPSGRRMDAILGYTLFRHCVVEVDYAKRVLTVREGSDSTAAARGTVVPIEILENHPYLEAELTVPGRAPITGRFVVDTGSASALILAPDFVARESLLTAITPTIRVPARGVGGGSSDPVGRVEAFAVGGYRLERPVAMLRQTSPGRISLPGTLGNVGGIVLRRFRVTFDYPRRRMLLEPAATLAEAFEADMTGTALVATGPNLDGVAIVQVLPGTPADAAGLRVGDAIETVDRGPVAHLGLSKLREMFRLAGRDYRLGIRRGSERLDVTLRTRRLI